LSLSRSLLCLGAVLTVFASLNFVSRGFMSHFVFDFVIGRSRGLMLYYVDELRPLF
jgi:hypothetical protein